MFRILWPLISFEFESLVFDQDFPVVAEKIRGRSLIRVVSFHLSLSFLIILHGACQPEARTNRTSAMK